MMNQNIIDKARCVIVGDKAVLDRAMTFPNMPKVKINVITNPREGDYGLGVVNVIDLNYIAPDQYEMGKVNAKCGKASYKYIEKAINMAMSGEADAVSTTPINKESLKAGEIRCV